MLAGTGIRPGTATRRPNEPKPTDSKASTVACGRVDEVHAVAARRANALPLPLRLVVTPSKTYCEGANSNTGAISLILAPQVTKPVAVFTDNAKDNSDDEVEVVHEQTPVLSGGANMTGEQGVLVKDILAAEKGLKVRR